MYWTLKLDTIQLFYLLKRVPLTMIKMALKGRGQFYW